MAHNSEDDSVLNKLDAAAAPLAKFDAFPKVPSTYKARSESRGFMTIFVMLVAFLFMLNDIGEYILGWPEYRFSVDKEMSPYMFINLDMVVNMPCKYLSVDLRDVVGDRLLLSGGFRRDGTKFDVSQATALKEHSAALSASQVVAQSRRSRGLFDVLLRRKTEPKFKPTYNHEADASACRIYGTLAVKRVTANLHITTLGHGYSSYQHVDHSQMNLSHVITEFSFGPYFPDITQPLDNSFEVTQEHFTAYQYYLHVVPTTYIAPRSHPLQTNQYSVTHYTRTLQHNDGTPGIFFKFDLDPMNITIHQKTTTFVQLMIRCVGVIGGIFVCMGYAIRITTRAVEVVSGADQTPGIVAAESSGVKVGLRAKWGGGELRARPQSGRMVRQGNGWVLEGGNSSSPYASYAPTPVSGAFASPGMPSPYLQSNAGGSAVPPPPPGSAVGLGFPSSTFGSAPGTPAAGANGHGHMRTPSLLGGPPRTPYPASLQANGATPSVGGPATGPGELPGTPSYSHFPPTPGPATNGAGNGHGESFAAQQQQYMGGPPKGKKDD
ncbi:Endoplasmic reticulum-Golgi intermediate compartment protein 2 [Leucoagaricus sp. SymC.cos]|nr:Endoplasmic reticulum-Golgi intermediate compartment protein 2 [Leucoagaricus sp. SymC.cos]